MRRVTLGGRAILRRLRQETTRSEFQFSMKPQPDQPYVPQLNSDLIDNGYFDLGTWNWTFHTK
jgi:hypothetical protein